MSKLFGDLTPTEKLEATTDRVGGGFEAIPTDIYEGTVKLAYVSKAAQSKASAVNLILLIDGKEQAFQVYVTNKNGENFYTDKENPTKKIPNSSFEIIDDLCLLTTNAGLIDQDHEEKVVKIYNYTERKEIPTQVPCLTALHGQPVKVAIQRQIVDKEKKDDSGEYKPTGETRTKNELIKFVQPDTNMTVNEYRAELTSAEWYPAWLSKNKGKDRDMSTKTAGGASGGGVLGTGRPGGTTMFGTQSSAAPKKTLFGK